MLFFYQLNIIQIYCNDYICILILPSSTLNTVDFLYRMEFDYELNRILVQKSESSRNC